MLYRNNQERHRVGTFTEAKQQFDDNIGRNSILPTSLVPEDGKPVTNIVIRNSTGEKNEQYYKWQFVYALTYSGLYAKDYIGTEIRFPKGNKTSAPIKLDGAIFDDADWLTHYQDYWKHRKSEDLEWLNQHLLAVIEFKKNDKEIEKVFSGQVKQAMREKDPPKAYVLGIYYEAGRLYLFHRRDEGYIRYDEAKNQKGEKSGVGDLSLHLPDPYFFIPSFNDLKNRVNRPSKLDRAKRGIKDLEIITSITTVQIQDALSAVLRTLHEISLVDQDGYKIIIETFALKIFDEKRNQKNPMTNLMFYITDEESGFQNLSEKPIQKFIERMSDILSEAEGQYHRILSENRVISWNKINYVRAVVAVCQAFQDFSFVRSSSSDLYQLVFYNFANNFLRTESAQFLTPLPVIRFIVDIVNPLDSETVLDPCCGIGDFLSLSFVQAQKNSSQWQVSDANIYGVDNDRNMIILATLNMLLNGDGEAKLYHAPDKGSINTKIVIGNPPKLEQLIPSMHKSGKWDNWPDTTKLMKFDVILTNPPFGKNGAFRPRNSNDRNIVEMYETWDIARNMIEVEDTFAATHTRGKAGKSKGKGTDAIDLGIIFLENAYYSLKVEGRLGIVLSNSIASINQWRKVREWFMERMRIVALFDLPSNVFAETGVNTSIIIAYKPKPQELVRLKEQGYSVFVRDIQAVGYEKRIVKRNVIFKPIYRFNETTFQVVTDSEDQPILDEQFSQTVSGFRQWVVGQEQVMKRLFLKGM